MRHGSGTELFGDFRMTWNPGEEVLELEDRTWSLKRKRLVPNGCAQ